MLSIAVTPAEHKAFTDAWRAAIPYGTSGTVTRQQVLDTAKTIYAGRTDILRALGLM